MKILFCIYQLDFADHIALAYLSAVARELGHERFLCVLKGGDLQESIALVKPDVVAYSANVWGFEELVAAHQAARKRYDFIAIMGGPQPTVEPEAFARAQVDAFCIGEGEGAFHDFLQRVAKGASFDDVPNLITARQSNPVRSLVANLDEIPFPDRDLTLANSFLKTTPKKTFYATRGCPYACKYCSNASYQALYRGKGTMVRRFGVERLMREIEYVRSRYRMDFVKFGDDLFAWRVDPWLEEFTEQYVRRVGIPFNCYLRFDMVSNDLLALLKRAGCFSVHLSVDSTSEHVREEILGRRMRKVDIPQTLKLINDFGINTWVNYMLAAPESSLQDDLATIAVSRQGHVTYAAYSTTVPMKGTPLYDYCVKHSLIDPQTHKSDMMGCNKPTTLKCFSEKEKKIRFNIYLLGAIIARLPQPFYQLGLWLLRVVPPNRLFRKIRQWYYLFNIENRIFRLHPS